MKFTLTFTDKVRDHLGPRQFTVIIAAEKDVVINDYISLQVAGEEYEYTPEARLSRAEVRVLTDALNSLAGIRS